MHCSENRWVKFQNISSSKAPLEKENLVLYESVITFLMKSTKVLTLSSALYANRTIVIAKNYISNS